MQTILGANGQIGQELAKALYQHHTKNIRLVSRQPQKIHDSDVLHPTDLMDAVATDTAVAGSDIVYFTAGLPMDSQLWEERFPVMMQNVINACKKHQCKLVFFDNTYMYPKTATPQTEQTPFAPVGRKSKVRAQIAKMVLAEMQQGTLDAMICRAPEFYGPDNTQSITNTLIFDNIKAGKKAKVPVSDSSKRTLIWTPDASRAMALLGNTPDAYQQTWHLPCAAPISYQDLLEIVESEQQQPITYQVIKLWMFKLTSWFNQPVKELLELLPRYGEDNLFVSDKFSNRFPEFQVTSHREGVRDILQTQ